MLVNSSNLPYGHQLVKPLDKEGSQGSEETADMEGKARKRRRESKPKPVLESMEDEAEDVDSSRRTTARFIPALTGKLPYVPQPPPPKQDPVKEVTKGRADNMDDFITILMKVAKEQIDQMPAYRIRLEKVGTALVWAEASSIRGHLVDFSGKIPKCTCAHWKKIREPCYHMTAFAQHLIQLSRKDKQPGSVESDSDEKQPDSISEVEGLLPSAAGPHTSMFPFLQEAVSKISKTEILSLSAAPQMWNKFGSRAHSKRGASSKKPPQECRAPSKKSSLQRKVDKAVKAIHEASSKIRAAQSKLKLSHSLPVAAGLGEPAQLASHISEGSPSAQQGESFVRFMMKHVKSAVEVPPAVLDWKKDGSGQVTVKGEDDMSGHVVSYQVTPPLCTCLSNEEGAELTPCCHLLSVLLYFIGLRNLSSQSQGMAPFPGDRALEKAEILLSKLPSIVDGQRGKKKPAKAEGTTKGRRGRKRKGTVTESDSEPEVQLEMSVECKEEPIWGEEEEDADVIVLPAHGDHDNEGEGAEAENEDGDEVSPRRVEVKRAEGKRVAKRLVLFSPRANKPKSPKPNKSPSSVRAKATEAPSAHQRKPTSRKRPEDGAGNAKKYDAEQQEKLKQECLTHRLSVRVERQLELRRLASQRHGTGMSQTGDTPTMATSGRQPVPKPQAGRRSASKKNKSAVSKHSTNQLSAPTDLESSLDSALDQSSGDNENSVLLGTGEVYIKDEPSEEEETSDGEHRKGRNLSAGFGMHPGVLADTDSPGTSGEISRIKQVVLQGLEDLDSMAVSLDVKGDLSELGPLKEKLASLLGNIQSAAAGTDKPPDTMEQDS